MNKLLLKENVEAILGPDDYSGIKEWYRDIIMSQYDYVVFTARKSYMLALIMEKVTGLGMEENSSSAFLTDSSIILFCSKFASQYRETGEFPKILLCDDTLIHGRGINHFLEDIEHVLYNLLPEYTEDIIEKALVKSIKVHVFVRAIKTWLILSRHEFNIMYKCKKDNAYIHMISNKISSLILCLDMANASYIYSMYLSDTDFNNLNLDGFIETSYQNTKQYARIQYVGQDEEKKAVFTLRIVKNTGSEGYRVIPFIFMPNMGGEETNGILACMDIRMREAGIRDNYIELLYYLKDIPGKRAFNELVTLWLSQAVLQDFCIQNGICNVMPEEDEIRKLARNFNYGSICGLDGMKSSEDMLRTIVSKHVFSLNSIGQIVNSFVQDGRKLLFVTKDDNGYVTDEEKRKIKYRLEDYFYHIAYEDEKEACILSERPYYHTDERSKRNARGCGFLLREVNSGYTELQAAYSFAYFLQMMDAGVLSLSSYAYRKVKVVGFSQFAKPGEQSLLLMPLRMYEWLPLISQVQRYCEWCGRKFSDEMYEYGNSKECDINSTLLIEEIVKFVDDLSVIRQEADEWIGYYINKIEVDISEGETLRTARFHFTEKQLAHVKKYAEYRGI